MPSAESLRMERAKGESGQAIVLMALFLSLVGLAIVGTVLDFGLLAARNSAADAAAYLGAQAGGGMINSKAFEVSGQLRLVGISGGACTEVGTEPLVGSCWQGGTLTAAGTCATVSGQNDPVPTARVTCVQRGLMVTATVQQTVTFPVAVFGVGGKVKSTRQAGPTYGTSHTIVIS